MTQTGHALGVLTKDLGQDLQRRITVQLVVAAAVNFAPAALTEFFLDALMGDLFAYHSWLRGSGSTRFAVCGPNKRHLPMQIDFDDKWQTRMRQAERLGGPDKTTAVTRLRAALDGSWQGGFCEHSRSFGV